jgi:hypothetical protein
VPIPARSSGFLFPGVVSGKDAIIVGEERPEKS